MFPLKSLQCLHCGCYPCKSTDLPYINLDVLRYWPNNVSIYYAHGIQTRLSDVSRYFFVSVFPKMQYFQAENYNRKRKDIQITNVGIYSTQLFIFTVAPCNLTLSNPLFVQLMHTKLL